MTDAFMEKFIPGTMIAALSCVGLSVFCMLAAMTTGNGYIWMATIWLLGLALIVWIAMMIAIISAMSR